MDKPKVRLLADRVLVSVVPTQELTTASGIIIPQTASKEQALVGEVLRVSSRIEKCDVEEDKVYIGEQVLFSKYAGTDLVYKGKNYKVLRITDILGAEEQ